MRVLVTGGAGYVGSTAARQLVASGHQVAVLDNLSEGHRQAAPPGTLAVGEIADGESVRALMREHETEALMHFASSCYVGVSMTDPRQYYRNNVAASLALFEAALDCGVSRVVFSSSCSVHGETRETLDEDSRVAPASTYAFTKHVIEQMIRDFSRAYGLSYALLRYFNASGGCAGGEHGEDHRPETHLIPIVIQTALGKRDELLVYGDDYDTPDGTCIRDYVHVEDLARAHESALARLPGSGADPLGLVYNLGTGSGSSVLEVIRSVERVSDKKVRYTVHPRRPGDTPRLVARSDRARSELGWAPQFDTLDAVVASAWTWHQRNPDGYPE